MTLSAADPRETFGLLSYFIYPKEGQL